MLNYYTESVPATDGVRIYDQPDHTITPDALDTVP